MTSNPPASSQVRPFAPKDADAVLEQILDARWSCRGFRPDPVARPVIERLLGLAQKSASWCNTQPWALIITEGEATARFAAGLFEHVAADAPPTPDLPWPEAYLGVYKERRRAVAEQLYASVGIQMGDRAASKAQTLENFRLFGAPHVAIVTTDKTLGLYGAVDCGLYVANFLNAASSLGLGTIAQAALAGYAGFVREHFAIPEDRAVLCGISFGWPDHDHPTAQFRSDRADILKSVDFRA